VAAIASANAAFDATPKSARSDDAVEAGQGAIHRNSEPAADLASTGAYARNMAEPPTMPAVVFVEADPATVVDGVYPGAFFEVAYEPVLARMIAHVVEVEGPVLALQV
jgi:hypothetical protein